MPMPYSHRSVLTHLYFFFFLHHFILTVAVNFPTPYSPIDNLAINCGSAGKSTSTDGRQWIGDIGSNFARVHQPDGKSVTSKAFHQLSDDMAQNPVPYMTARISRFQFSYTFKVNPGQKFIRLHFHPASYPGFERSKAFFTVKAGPYTLLSNFSASLTADALGLRCFVKEFCLNADENQALTITFFPCPSSTAYAFINGIEIVSMPTGLYYSQGSDPGVHVVGQNYRFYIENSTALEVVQRLNVGGSSISSIQDSGMFREWSEDSHYLIESGVFPIITTIPIKYTSIPTYTAPQKVYQTAWSMGPTKQSNQKSNFTWKLPVDLGFRYLIRLHFCELEYGIKESGNRGFCVFINKQIVEAYADVIEWSGGNGVAMYRDYVVMIEGDRMEGKRDLLIALRSHCHDCRTEHATNPILNGLEVFKLSNPDNNLAGPNPVFLADAQTSKTSKSPKQVLVFDSGNALINGVIIFITLVNIVVYQLRIWAENSGNKNISKPSPKETCRRFSLVEMQLATNNFDDAFIIGCGGFGKVYKGGLSNEGVTSSSSSSSTVAIKRLNPESKQGAREFWTEIEMLSELRHINLVTLIGYCNDCQEMILVYEYMAHGTLADHIHKAAKKDNGISRLTWEQRLKICIGAARGLNYLHTGIHQTIIHRDVKSTNILLDESWVAKISDFGLSKMGIISQSRSYVSTNVKGTCGYLDPEYYSTRRLTKKSDVYAFGVVLLEALCGRPAVDMRLEEDQHSLALWAQHCIREGMIDQIIDPYLRTQISPHCLKLYAEVASKCLHNYSKDRPTMDDVVGSLELTLASQESSCSSSDIVEAINVGGADSQLGGADSQCIENPTFGQDHTPSSKKRTKSAITKVVVQSLTLTTKVKDLQRKKTTVYGSDNGSSWWWWRKPRTQKKMKTKQPRDRFEETETKRLPALLEDLCHHFSLAEIRAATNNFEDDLIMGHSYFTTSYKGYIDDRNLVVVIRRFKPNSQWARECWANMEILAEIRHVHLLSSIGYCNEEGEMILVYNYMENGSLSDHLFGGTDNEPLPWKKRLEICIGVARGLHYLHAAARQTIVHSYLKSTKILLDDDWVPKVSEVELSKVLVPRRMATTGRTRMHVAGTSAYLDPEYRGSAQVADKYDVYLFGLVLLEVLSGRKASIPVQDCDWSTLVHWFKRCLMRKSIHHFIDPDLMGKMSLECFKEFVNITWSCLLDQGIERPTMDDVVRRLQLALQLQETSGDHIHFWGASVDDKAEMSFKAPVAQAYNAALFKNNRTLVAALKRVKIADTRVEIPNTWGLSCAALEDFADTWELSCAALEDSDYFPSNLAR